MSKIEFKKRIKSLLWRAGGMAVIAIGTYFLKIGDLWALDPKMLVNLGAVAFVSLIVNEITKQLNK